MKNILKAAAVALLAVSCGKANEYGGSSVSFRIGNLHDISIEDVTKSSLADFVSVPSAGDFTIKVTDESKATLWEGLLSNWNAEEKIFTGKYNVAASYGTKGEEGYGKAYIAGDADFTVNSASKTVVDLKVSLQNAILKLECTPSFKNYFSQCEFTLQTGSGAEFNMEENNPVFVEAFRFTLSGRMKNPQGIDAEFQKEYSSQILPGKCYTILLDASNVGSGSISVSFNNEVDTVDLGNIELNN